MERLESLLHGATTSLTNGHVTEEEVYKTLSPTRCASWVVERLVSVNWFPTFSEFLCCVINGAFSFEVDKKTEARECVTCMSLQH